MFNTTNKTITGCIVLLSALISFLPEYVLGRYWNGTTGFLMIFLSILILHEESRRHLFHISDWPLWLLLAGLLSGVVAATDRNEAWRTYVHLAAAFFLLFYIGKGIFSSSKFRLQAVYCICFSASVVVVIALLELYFKCNVLYENFIPNPFYERYVHVSRLMSTQANPAVLGTYMVATLPFSLVLWKRKPYFVRLWGICLTVLSFGVSFLAFSRAAFIGVVGSLLLYLFLKGRRSLVLVLLCLTVLLSLFCLYSDSDSIRRYSPEGVILGHGSSIASPYRLERMGMTERMLGTSPLFGVGFQHFRIRFSEFAPPASRRTSFEIMIPDNMYLTFLAETGVVGTLTFLIFIFMILRRALMRLKTAGSDENRQVLMLLVCALAGFLVNMVGYDMFYWQNPPMLFALICGLTAGLEVQDVALRDTQEAHG